MNRVLQDRGLPVLADEEAYRRAFGFPITCFYSRLDLDGVSFADAADQYLAHFAETVGQASLQRGARETLAAICAIGVAPVLLSATPVAVLERPLGPHPVEAHFTRILR